MFRYISKLWLKIEKLKRNMFQATSENKINILSKLLR